MSKLVLDKVQRRCKGIKYVYQDALMRLLLLMLLFYRWILVDFILA